MKVEVIHPIKDVKFSVLSNLSFNTLMSNFVNNYIRMLMWISYKQLETETYNWYNVTCTNYDAVTWLHYIRSSRSIQKPKYQTPTEYIGLTTTCL